MGIDLALLPQRHNKVGNYFLAYDRLSVDRDYPLFDEIKLIESHELSRFIRFEWYGDNGIEMKTKDPYGTRLTYIKAGDLVEAFKNTFFCTSQRNRAVGLYLDQLPVHYIVVLWWH